MISGVTQTPVLASEYTKTSKAGGKAVQRIDEQLQAEQLERIRANQARKEQELAVPRKQASGEDIAELAAKYDPENMSQQEYDAFLRDLVDRGILRKHEIGRLGYNGITVVGELTEDSFLHGSITCQAVDDSIWDSFGGMFRYLAFRGTTLGLRDTYGNALALARIMGSWKTTSGSPDQVAFENRKSEGYAVMADVLEAMQARRGI